MAPFRVQTRWVAVNKDRLLCCDLNGFMTLNRKIANADHFKKIYDFFCECSRTLSKEMEDFRGQTR
jgi:hypothetical protein